MTNDKKYMHRALQLARKGLGSTSPNPLVGSVIVHNNTIIGEGYHHKAGEAHAEVNAINSVENKELLRQSTIYVSLEPCSHYGKTPPCADLIIEHCIPRVVIACTDPNPQVSGRGIERLRNSGIKVEEGVCKIEAEYLNRRFFTTIRRGRPYIILKWAETPRGFMDEIRDSESYSPKWLTNRWAKMLVHKQRTEEDAIMAGTNTIRLDNPALTAREWNGINPIRVLVDRHNIFSTDIKVFDENGAKVICFCSDSRDLPKHIIYESIAECDNEEELMMQSLIGHGINSIIIEGGSKYLLSFIQKGLWDEAFRYIGETEFKNGVKAPFLTNERLMHVNNIDKTRLYHYCNYDNPFI